MALSFHEYSQFLMCILGLRNIWRRFPIFWLAACAFWAPRLYGCISISSICPAYIWLIVKVVYVCSRSPHSCCCLSATRYKEKKGGKKERQTKLANKAKQSKEHTKWIFIASPSTPGLPPSPTNLISFPQEIPGKKKGKKEKLFIFIR